jgi:hypothetical protein
VVVVEADIGHVAGETVEAGEDVEVSRLELDSADSV